MVKHKTGTREEQLAERIKLLDAEKEPTRRSDELAQQRQGLPWVKIDKKYWFQTEEGEASLKDLMQAARAIANEGLARAKALGAKEDELRLIALLDEIKQRQSTPLKRAALVGLNTIIDNFPGLHVFAALAFDLGSQKNQPFGP